MGRPLHDDLADLPKAHLHLHLFGSARLSTIKELAAEQGISLHGIQDFTDLPSFMVQFLAVEHLIRTPEAIERICRELVADEAAAGSRYIEPSFVPHDFARMFHMTPEQLFDRMDRAFQEAGAQYGVTVRYIIAPNRARDFHYLMEAAEFAVRMKDRGVVAFGYGGDERWGHRRMRKPVRVARSGGLKIVPHAGEALGAESVAEALALINPDRIAHGVRAVEDPAVLSELARRGIGCDVCISSNVRLGVYPDAAHHPLKEMLLAGVSVSLNADDELFFASSILNEYRLARDELHLPDEALAHIARCGFLNSSAPEPVVRRALADIDAWEHRLVRVKRQAPPANEERRRSEPGEGREIA